MDWRLLCFCVFIQAGSEASLLTNLTLEEVIRIQIPTIEATNQLCRNQSLLYLQELKNLKVWASEMFDASSKVPVGFIFGSSYNLGSFDECIEVTDVSQDNETFMGKYCLVKFYITPPTSERNFSLNSPVWNKINNLSSDIIRMPRNEFYLAYCIPSTCEYTDLESSLQKVIGRFNFNIGVNVRVDSFSCQVKDENKFDTGDIIFIAFLMISICLSFTASLYEGLIKRGHIQKRKGRIHGILLSFSITNHFKSLGKPCKDDELQFIHGVKFFCMFGVIIGHRIMLLSGSPLLNPGNLENIFKTTSTGVLSEGTLIVHYFFTISGFLFSVFTLRYLNKHKVTVNYLYMILHRYLRLTPAYAVIIALQYTVFVKMGSGPFWKEKIKDLQNRCLSNWWTNLLYINNYVNPDEMCVFQSWYLACDMQYFVITLIILWLFRKRSFYGITATLCLQGLAVIVCFTTIYVLQARPILTTYLRYSKDPSKSSTFKNLHVPIQSHLNSYLSGLMAGYLKWQMHIKQHRLPIYLICIGWILCFTLGIGIMYLGYLLFYIPERTYDAFLSGTYAALSRLIIGICVSWGLFAISEGYDGGILNRLLSWKPLIPLGRLTYTTFLSHLLLQYYTIGTLRHPNNFTIFNVFYMLFSDTFLAYCAGLILSLLFEAPIISLEKILFKMDL